MTRSLLVLLAALVSWWVARSLRAWTGGDEWAKAASIVTGVVLAHSLVDYPLRTPALLLCFLFHCVLLHTLTVRRTDDPGRPAAASPAEFAGSPPAGDVVPR